MGAIRALKDRAEREEAAPIGPMSCPGQALFDRYPATARPISTIEPLGNAGGLSGAEPLSLPSRSRRARRSADGPSTARPSADLESIHELAEERRRPRLRPRPVYRLSTAGRWSSRTVGPGRSPPGCRGGRPRSSTLARSSSGPPSAASPRSSPGSSRASLVGAEPRPGPRLTELERLMLRRVRARSAPGSKGPRPTPHLVSPGDWLDRAVRLAPTVIDSTRLAATRLLPLQALPPGRPARPFPVRGGSSPGLVDFGAMGVDSVAGDLAGFSPRGSARIEWPGARRWRPTRRSAPCPASNSGRSRRSSGPTPCSGPLAGSAGISSRVDISTIPTPSSKGLERCARARLDRDALISGRSDRWSSGVGSLPG